MADDRRNALPGWAFGSFHAAVLVTTLVTVGYSVGVLGDVLAGLRTALGLAAYVYLWIVTVVTARRWLDDLGPNGVIDADLSRLLATGARWGAVTGVAVLVGVLVPGGAGLLLSAGIDAVGVLLVIGGVGAIASLVVGGVIGASFALIDRGVVHVSRLIVPSTDPG